MTHLQRRFVPLERERVNGTSARPPERGRGAGSPIACTPTTHNAYGVGDVGVVEVSGGWAEATYWAPWNGVTLAPCSSAVRPS
ncbi:hypothetical protein GCM10009799_10110 [Nocardiopsis rhodophaea]|uniref:Uncharacterized protein n=1 Tax=Nocardiopsis rhodophaea TaxID=280238 RepID=A0ABN2SGY5_9ACTN